MPLEEPNERIQLPLTHRLHWAMAGMLFAAGLLFPPQTNAYDLQLSVVAWALVAAFCFGPLVWLVATVFDRFSRETANRSAGKLPTTVCSAVKSLRWVEALGFASIALHVGLELSWWLGRQVPENLELLALSSGVGLWGGAYLVRARNVRWASSQKLPRQRSHT